MEIASYKRNKVRMIGIGNYLQTPARRVVGNVGPKIAPLSVLRSMCTADSGPRKNRIRPLQTVHGSILKDVNRNDPLLSGHYPPSGPTIPRQVDAANHSLIRQTGV